MSKLLLLSLLFILATCQIVWSQTYSKPNYTVDNRIFTTHATGDTLILGGDFRHYGIQTGGIALLTATSDLPAVNFPKIRGNVFASAPDSKGGWYISGIFSKESEGDSPPKSRIEHILPDNTFDQSFSIIDNEAGSITGIVIQGDRMYIHGSWRFSTFQGKAIDAIAAIDLSTRKFVEWAPKIKLNYLGGINKVLIQGNTMFIAGSFTQAADQNRNGLVAIDLHSGSVKPWNPAFAEKPDVKDLVLYKNELIIGGSFADARFEQHSCVKVDTISGRQFTYLFNSKNTYWGAGVQSVEVNQDTLFAKTLGTFDTRIAAYNLATNQFLWRKYFNMIASVNDMKYHNGTLYMAGSFESYNDLDEKGNLKEIRKIGNLIAIDPTTGNLRDWHPSPANHITYEVWTLSMANDRIFAGGRFDLMKASARNSVLMYDAKNKRLLPWNAGLDDYASVNAIKLIDTTLYIAGRISTAQGQKRANIAAYSVRSGKLLNWVSETINGDVFTLEADDRYLYVGGQFNKVGSQSKTNLIAIDRKTGNATSWSPNPNSSVYILRLQGDRLYAGGDFWQVGGQTKPYLAAFNYPNLQLLAWNPNPDGGIRDIAVADSSVYVVGRFSSFGNERRVGFAGIHRNTGKLTAHDPFNGRLGPDVRSIRLKGRYAFIGGRFSFAHKNRCQNLFAVDLTPNPSTKPDIVCLNSSSDHGINTITFIKDTLYFGGIFEQINQSNARNYGIYSFPAGFFEPKIDDYFPKIGGNGGDVTINFYGDLIKPGMKLKLVRTGAPDIVIPDSLIAFPQQYQMQVTSDLRKKTIGNYDLVLSAPNQPDYVINRGFTIERVKRYDPWTEIIGPDAIRRNRPQVFNIAFGNRGNIDARGLIIWLAVPDNVKIEFGFNIVNSQLKAVDSVMYVSVDTLSRLPFKGRVYGLFIPVIKAGAVENLPIKVTSQGDFKLITWISKRPLYASPLNCDITECLYKSLFAVADLVFDLDKLKGIPQTVYECFVALTADQLDPIVSGDIKKVNGNREAGLAYVGDAMAAFAKSMYGCADAATDLAGLFPAARYLKVLKRIMDGTMSIRDFQDAAKACMEINCEKEPDDKNPNDGGDGSGNDGSGSDPGDDQSYNEDFFPPDDEFDPGDWRDWLLPPYDPSKRNDQDTKEVNSFDPNDKIGIGVNAAHYVNGRDPMQYLIRFENKETATAAAQNVRVVDTLDRTKFDLRTFQLGYFHFGSRYVNVKPGQKKRTDFVDLRPSKNLIVRIDADFDDSTGIFITEFTSLDPKTMVLTEDPILGFLPPNKNAPEGDGSIYYTVKAKADLPNKTEIKNRAYIYFDDNAVIPTPVCINTLDKQIPDSRINDLPSVIADTSFTIRWQGKDTESGLKLYNVYYSINNKPYKTLLSSTTSTTLAFTGKIDSTYRFYSVAIDSVMNRETAPATFDAQTTIRRVLAVEPSLASAVKVYPNPADAKITIELPAQLSVENVTLINATGQRKILSDVRIRNSTTFDIHTVPVGVYIIQLRTKDGIINRRILIK